MVLGVEGKIEVLAQYFITFYPCASAQTTPIEGMRNTEPICRVICKNFGLWHGKLPWKIRAFNGTADDILYVYFNVFSCLVVFIQLLMHQRVTQKFLLLDLQFYISINQYAEFLRIPSISSKKFFIEMIRKIFCVSPSLARKNLGYAKFWNFLNFCFKICKKLQNF